MNRMQALLQHQGPLLHVDHSHRVARTGMPAKPPDFYYHASAADVAREWSDLEYYDPKAPDYLTVAFGAIDQSFRKEGVCEALRLVPYDHPEYYTLANMTIELDPASISEVDPRMGPIYVSVAKDAIKRMPEAIDKFLIRPSRVGMPVYNELVAYAEQVKADRARDRAAMEEMKNYMMGAFGAHNNPRPASPPRSDDDDGPVYRTWEREAGRALAAQRARSRSSSPVRSGIHKSRKGNRRSPARG